MKDFTNVVTEIDGDILTIVIDMSEEHGHSKSGKSKSIASTHGNVKLDGTDGVKLNVNCYKTDMVAIAKLKATEDAEKAEFEEYKRLKRLKDNAELVGDREEEANEATG